LTQVRQFDGVQIEVSCQNQELTRFRAGTNPLDANSKFGFTDIRIDAQPGIVLRWPSVTNRTYSILRSTNLLQNFSVTASNIVATPP